MKILIINPPHPAIGSRIPKEHLPPLGLLALGGPLIDAGHTVHLLNADLDPMNLAQIVQAAGDYEPEAVLIGHSGSTSGHPVSVAISRAIKAGLPNSWIIYGGVFPTFHPRAILEKEPAIDFIVKGEGEETIIRLIAALDCLRPWVMRTGPAGSAMSEHALLEIPGIVFRRGVLSAACGDNTEIIENGAAPLIEDLDSCRVGWELIDHTRYTYWGNRRAVVVQFSRGCPHRCGYCGQRGFWGKWRHRDPVKFAAELARLHREKGVKVINFADENPTACQSAWRAFIEALIAENVPLILVASTRADDIVRDADLLHLYKRAGVARLLLGIESTDEQTLRAIRKGSSQAMDREAIRLLRKHGIISMAAWVADFKDATDSDYFRALRQILSYDPDQIQALYATPHHWTAFARESAERRVIQRDLSLWDYKHQVLESSKVPPWRVLAWVKLIESVAQLRPKSLLRLLAHPDSGFQTGMRWYYEIGRKVWPYELWHWLFGDCRTNTGPSLAQFWETFGTSQEATPVFGRTSSSALLASDGRRPLKRSKRANAFLPSASTQTLCTGPNRIQ
jgi:anaerobic magnesium-protoporphyrin IX monomethyl ester cyclase